MFLWDYILTFDMEVELVWKSKWNFIKGLYLFQRYLPFTQLIWFFLPYCQSNVISILSYSILFYRGPRERFDGDWVSEGTICKLRFVKLTSLTLKYSRWNLFYVQYCWSLGFLHQRASSAYTPRFQSYSLMFNSDSHATDMGRVESELAIDHCSFNPLYPFCTSGLISLVRIFNSITCKWNFNPRS